MLPWLPLRRLCDKKLTSFVRVRYSNQSHYGALRAPNTQRRGATSAAEKQHMRSWSGKERYSILDLQKNRLWAEVAGVDPTRDRHSFDVWSSFRSIAIEAYLAARFDVATPWTSQEPLKKREAHDQIVARVLNDNTLSLYPGLQHPDLIAMRLCHLHRNQRSYLQKLVKENKSGSRSLFIGEILQGMQHGEIKLLSKPHSHHLGTLQSQGARVALSREQKRLLSNDLKWKRNREAFRDEPHDPQRDLDELAQAPSNRSAGAIKRWQRYYEAVRNGIIPIHARLRSDETRAKQSQKAKERLAKVDWTEDMREKKRRAGAIGLEKQRQARLLKSP